MATPPSVSSTSKDSRGKVSLALRHRSPSSTPPSSTLDDTESKSLRSVRSSRNGSASTLQSLLTSQRLLCNAPVLVLVIVASLDNADKQLLASSFAMLERTLHLDVKLLGYFSLFTNLSYALSLPFWGYLVHKYGMDRIHILLSAACASWGLATIGIAAAGSSIVGQALFRSLNGVALGSILPLSQTLLVELVAVDMRGRAFGFMGLCEKLAGTIAAASIVYLDNWQHPYYCLGIFSVLMAVIARQQLDPRKIKRLHSSKEQDDENKDTGPELTLKQIVQRIAKIPAFTCLVAQGVFGGTPWDMMSFMLLLLDWRGFNKDQIVLIQFTSGMSSVVGGWLGGILGDYADQRLGNRGRIAVASVSVIGGIPLYGLFLHATDYRWALLWFTLFNVWATWPPACALRPLCAALTRNPSERAQIVSMWIVLEKVSGAIFGAPLVGYLTSNMLSETEMQETGISSQKARALAFNLFALSSLFWAICACFWLAMAYTMRPNAQTKEKGHSDEEEVELMAPLV
jgi:MFS family permease